MLSPTGVHYGNSHSMLPSVNPWVSFLLATLHIKLTPIACNSTIDSVSQHHDLGILLDDNISWHQHYANIISKAYSTLRFIRHSTSKTHSTFTKLSLYISLVWPQLLYCSQVWRPHLIKHIKNFETVQRRATKFILHNFNSSYQNHLLTLKLLPLSLWMEYLDLVFLIKCLKEPSNHFSIEDHIQFISSNICSSQHSKLKCSIPVSSSG